MKEKSLYEHVRNFIESEFSCFHTSIEKGTQWGKIDVVGLRRSIGYLGGHTEVISVEVKPKKYNFLKSIGQAYSYSVMADLCFLAVHKPYDKDFTQEEKDIALKLGVGLIKIGSHYSCNIISSSPMNSPLPSYRLSLINKLGFVQCMICKTFFQSEDLINQKERKIIATAIQERKPLCYWLDNLAHQKNDNKKYIRDRRHICADCIQVFAGLLEY